MKLQLNLAAILMLTASVAFTACDEKKDDNNSLLLLLLAGGGGMKTYTADGVSFKMAYVPGGVTFPTGTDDLGTPATVANAYWIGETEVTYELWQKVYSWATTDAGGGKRADGGDLYTFANVGIEGSTGSGSIQQPVTTINWRDSMVWCNALTEWYNVQKGTSCQCVYCTDSGYTLPLRVATDSITITWESGAGPHDGTQDDPFVNQNSKGFRLLTSNEWELAARWRDNSTNTVSGYTNPYFTKGNSASCAYTYYDDATDTNPANGVVDGKDANDLLSVYAWYFDGDSWEPTGVTGTAVVKSKTSGANSLGLYDMSGNVLEWCFDWYPGWEGSFRVLRGGSWSSYASALRVGLMNDFNPYYEDINLGFRFARSAD